MKRPPRLGVRLGRGAHAPDWSVNAFEGYNSQPPADQKKNDFGVSATVGWSF